MKKALILITLILPSLSLFSQNTEAEKQLTAKTADTLEGWKAGGMINISTAQTSLSNWAAGGQSSVAVNGLMNLYVQYKQDKSLWENYLNLGYGSLKQGKNSWWKTDDKIEFTTKYGYETVNKLYIAALVNFRSQFANGYNYPNDSVIISGFFSPGYILGAIGLDYVPGEHFTLFVAPIAGRTTVVTKKALSDEGDFGVKPGKQTYNEFGGYLRMFLKYNIMENVSFQTKLDLFSNYLDHPENIDVNWETLISMKVNKFIAATLSTDLVYDDNVKYDVNKGSRVQFKEILAVGFSYKF